MTDKPMTIPEAANALGMPRQTLAEWVRRGDIPGAWQIRHGGMWRIPAAWVQERLGHQGANPAGQTAGHTGKIGETEKQAITAA